MGRGGDLLGANLLDNAALGRSLERELDPRSLSTVAVDTLVPPIVRRSGFGCAAGSEVQAEVLVGLERLRVCRS